MGKFRGVFVLHAEQGQVAKFVQGGDPHLLVKVAFELSLALFKNFDRNLRLAFDDMKVLAADAMELGFMVCWGRTGTAALRQAAIVLSMSGMSGRPGGFDLVGTGAEGV